MNPEGALSAAVVALSLAAQAFFAAARQAIAGASALRLEEAARAGDAGAARALWYRALPDRLQVTTRVGGTLAAISAAAVAAEAFRRTHGLAGAGWALALMLPLALLLGEVVPQAAAEARSTERAPRLAQLLFLASIPFWPVVAITRAYAAVWARATDLPRPDEALASALSREDLVHLVGGDAPEGEIDAGERRMITRILELADLRARDVMIPLVDVCAVSAETTVREAAAVVAEHGYSRLPVYGERPDDVVGLLHHLDLLAAEDGDRPVGELAKRPHFVAEGQEIDELLVILQRSAATAAMVLDEYGGVVGLITLEDILEEIVGDIDDEFDHAEAEGLWRRAPDGWIVSGRAPVEKVNARLGLELPESDEYETLAGFLLDRLKRVPQQGESLTTAEGVHLVVHRASDRAIEEILVSTRTRPPPAS